MVCKLAHGLPTDRLCANWSQVCKLDDGLQTHRWFANLSIVCKLVACLQTGRWFANRSVICKLVSGLQTGRRFVNCPMVRKLFDVLQPGLKERERACNQRSKSDRESVHASDGLKAIVTRIRGESHRRGSTHLAATVSQRQRRTASIQSKSEVPRGNDGYTCMCDVMRLCFASFYALRQVVSQAVVMRTLLLATSVVL